MSLHKLTTTLLLLAGISYGVLAQDTTHRSPLCIDINKIPLSFFLTDKYLSAAYIDHKTDLATAYPNLVFQNGRIHKGLIPNNYVTKKAIIRFAICNSGDTSMSAWLF